MVSSSQILQIMIMAAQQSAGIIRANFRQSSETQNKLSHLDIVTKTDVESQDNIHGFLISEMTKLGVSESEIGFVEEESKTDQVKQHTFIIDPIDGTTNFASGLPYCCISIAYAVDQQVNLGVVLDPFSNTLYWGEVGKGSFVKSELLGERKLRLDIKPQKSWIVGAHFNGLEVVDSQFELYQKIYPSVRGLRNFGSLTLDLCMMADNIFDVIFNKGCYLWDLAAASVILTEAGGQLYDLKGEKLEFDWTDSKHKYHLFAAHPDARQDIMDFLE